MSWLLTKGVGDTIVPITNPPEEPTMAMVQLDLPHEGETLDEAIRDIETRYGVTVTVVEETSGTQGWPIVRVNGADDDQLVKALRGGWSLDDEELREHGLID